MAHAEPFDSLVLLVGAISLQCCQAMVPEIAVRVARNTVVGLQRSWVHGVLSIG